MLFSFVVELQFILKFTNHLRERENWEANKVPNKFIKINDQELKQFALVILNEWKLE